MLEQEAHKDCSQFTPTQDPEQADPSMSSIELAASGQPPLCMDAELQWDAAILTVMVNGHADAGADEKGKLPFLHASCFCGGCFVG